MRAFKLRADRGCWFALGFLCLAVGSPGIGQAPPASRPSVATLSVTTREVLLDVLVTDAAGHPVTAMKASDFSLTEEGAPQTIKSLEEHRPMTPAEVAKLQSAPALAPNTFTNYVAMVNTNASTVILLDALDTPLTLEGYLREQVIEYLNKLQPGVSIAIFQLDTEMRLIQGFSSDQQVLLAAAKSKRDMPTHELPIGNGPNDEYRRVRLQILRDGMRLMGRYLAGFPGRKNLIWFTGRVPLTIFGTGLGNPFRDSFSVEPGSIDDLGDLAAVLTLSRVAVYPIDTRGLQVEPQFDAATKGPVSPNSNIRFDRRQDLDHNDLETVATATGGKAYYNTNGLKDVIAEIVNHGSNYYTLAYTTTNKEWNGHLRHIKVTVDRPGLTLRHRPGYYAYNRDQQEQRQLASLERSSAQTGGQPQDAEAAGGDQPAETPAAAPTGADDSGALVSHPSKGGLAESMALGAIAPTEVIFTAKLSVANSVMKVDKNAPQPASNFLRPPYQDKPFRIYTVLIRADARKMKLTQTPEGTRHGSVEMVAVVYDQSGGVVNTLRSAVALDLSAEKYRKLMESGLPARTQIAIPVKGNFFLRLGMHDVEGDQIGAIEIPVDQVKLGLGG